MLYTDAIDPTLGPQLDPSYMTWYSANYVRYIRDPDVRTIRGFNPHGERLFQTVRFFCCLI